MKKVSFLFCLLAIISCKQDRKDTFFVQSENPQSSLNEHSLVGRTMGTSYSIKYLSAHTPTPQSTIDSILISINEAVSTYIPESTISKLNTAGDEGIKIQIGQYPDQHFVENYFTSIDLFKQTNGYFDPSVMPLVNYWGFGTDEKKPVTSIDSNKVQSLLKIVGMGKFYAEGMEEQFHFTKKHPSSTLDFSAIAKGYAVDKIGEHLEAKGINSYMVEIGGEVKVKGKNKKDQFWKLGINTPEEGAAANDIQLIVSPKDKALASSGNYRIFHKLDDVSYGHEINPKTGYPQVTDILSASVIHDQCMLADAYATAFMIMGLEKSLEMVNSKADLEACFIVKQGDNFKHVYSQGFEDFLVR